MFVGYRNSERAGGGGRYAPQRGDGEAGYALDVVQDAFGSDAPGGEAFGDPSIIDGAIGRGASVWTPVIEWALDVGVPALAPAAAWETIKLAARQASGTRVAAPGP